MTFNHIYLISFLQADEACVPSLFFPTESKKQWFAGLSPLSIVKMKIDENSMIRFFMGPMFYEYFRIPLSPLSGPEIQPQLCPLLGKFRLCQSQASPRSPSLLSNSPSSSLLSNCSSSSHFLSTCLNRHSLRVISLLPSGLIDTKQGDQLKTDACIL